MRADGHQQIRGSPVVQEKDPLSETPERRRPELVRRSLALNDVVGEAGTHLVERDVGEQVHGLVAQGGDRRVARRHTSACGNARIRRCRTEVRPDVMET